MNPNPTIESIAEKQRTNQQNKALHVYFELVAEALNDAGLDIQEVISHAKIDIPWSKESVKELLWKTIQRSIYKKDSTTQLTKLQEIDKIYDVLNRFLAKLGVESVNFPSIETLMLKMEAEKENEKN